MSNPTLPFPYAPDYSAAAWLPTRGTTQAVQVLSTLAGQGSATPTVILLGPAATGKTHLLNIWHTQTGGHVTDDLQRLSLAEQETLFHTFNAAKQSGTTLLLATRTPPAQLENILPDLRSRLTTALVLELSPPTDEERKQLLLKWLSERQLNLAPPVQDFLLTHASRNVGELHSLVAQLDDLSLGQARPITIPLIKSLINQVF
jgi:chromosomal replication initiation ATPase DnaA